MPSRPTDRPLSIGALLSVLTDEFPDLTISKVRFLEAEGLLKPDRTEAGYRQYTRAHVDRLRYILRAQRDHFWPLRVIREALDALDRGLEPAADPRTTDARPRPPEPTEDRDLAALTDRTTDSGGAAGRSDRPVRLTRGELAEASGLADAVIADLEGHGLLHAHPAGHYDEDALRVVHAVAGLAEYGLEPRHLRAFRTAADREVGLVRQAVAGRPAATRGADTAAVARLTLQLHAALLKAGLTDPS